MMTRPAANIGDPGRRLGQVCAELPGNQGVADHRAERPVFREVAFGEPVERVF